MVSLKLGMKSLEKMCGEKLHFCCYEKLKTTFHNSAFILFCYVLFCFLERVVVVVVGGEGEGLLCVRKV